MKKQTLAAEINTFFSLPMLNPEHVVKEKDCACFLILHSYLDTNTTLLFLAFMLDISFGAWRGSSDVKMFVNQETALCVSQRAKSSKLLA